ncbi:putative hypothetical protein [Clostridium botulinum BKT015925]|nr:putative hypothetical protein [Clostridium botulinum BKT015925]
MDCAIGMLIGGVNFVIVFKYITTLRSLKVVNIKIWDTIYIKLIV